jgi:tRNA threonylcarbamoyladenosine biosynthesis protein TsaE
MLTSTCHKEIKYKELSELASVAGEIIDFADVLKVWIFEGEMGAGKTTLIKEICRLLKVKNNVTSPTFSIVNEYLTEKGETVYHFDFYRIKSESEAMDIGVEEYLYSGRLCFIEWPSLIPNLLPPQYLKINIQSAPMENRIIQLFKYEN